jgi:hypothetical protein
MAFGTVSTVGLLKAISHVLEAGILRRTLPPTSATLAKKAASSPAPSFSFTITWSPTIAVW